MDGSVVGCHAEGSDVKAVVVADGEPLDADVAELRSADVVIAADGGARWLMAHDRLPDLLVGDLDSLAPDAVAELAGAGVAVERHPVDKDESDTELAVERAVALGAAEIVVLGALGGSRIDHELANLLLLADPAIARDGGRGPRAIRGATTVLALPAGSPLALDAVPGDVVTLLPIGGDATGVRTEGLRFPLHEETLRMGRSRGLSNEAVNAAPSVRLEHGTLLVVHERTGGAPGAPSPAAGEKS
jgi:thiamine pyrophosphokinase